MTPIIYRTYHQALHKGFTLIFLLLRNACSFPRSTHFVIFERHSLIAALRAFTKGQNTHLLKYALWKERANHSRGFNAWPLQPIPLKLVEVYFFSPDMGLDPDWNKDGGGV